MSINNFVEMTILLCLICFVICARTQGFVDEYVFFFSFFFFWPKFKMATKNAGKRFFLEKSPVDSADTLGVKNIGKIALSLTFSEINAFLCFFAQKFKMATKNGEKVDFWEKSSEDSGETLWAKDSVEITILHCFRDKCEIQHGRHKWRENNFWEKLPVHSANTLWVKSRSG